MSLPEQIDSSSQKTPLERKIESAILIITDAKTDQIKFLANTICLSQLRSFKVRNIDELFNIFRQKLEQRSEIKDVNLIGQLYPHLSDYANLSVDEKQAVALGKERLVKNLVALGIDTMIYTIRAIINISSENIQALSFADLTKYESE